MSKHSQVSQFLGFLGLAGFLALTACSPKISAEGLPSFPKAPDAPDKNAPNASAFALDGKWMSACVPSSPQSRTYEATVMTFAGNNFETTSNTYPDAACKNAEMSISMQGTFSVAGAAAVPAGIPDAQARNVDVVIKGDRGETLPLYTVFELDGGTKLYTAEASQDQASRPLVADHSVAFTRVN